MADLVNTDNLLAEAANGDEVSFRCIFDAHHQAMGRYIQQLTGSKELAEEIVQDVFLKIWLNRQQLAGVRDIGAYLFHLAKNAGLNAIREQLRRQLRHQKWEESSVAETTHYPDTEDPYQLLDQAIDHLPHQQQKVYLMSRHDRLKYRDIADKLNLSTETVKKYLKIATASITAYVNQHMGRMMPLLGGVYFFIKNLIR